MKTADTDTITGLLGRYRLNEPVVITDVIDGEFVILNLQKGSYYGLDPIGSEIWQRIIAGESVSEIVRSAEGCFGLAATRIGPEIERFVSQLLSEDLITTIDECGTAQAPAAEAGFAAAQYRTPMLAVYADMKNLLALDPPLPG